MENRFEGAEDEVAPIESDMTFHVQSSVAFVAYGILAFNKYVRIFADSPTMQGIRTKGRLATKVGSCTK